MRKIVERTGTTISALICIIGVFGCLCECNTDNWLKYLIIFAMLAFIGMFGFFAFLDLTETKLYIRKLNKKIEGIWCYIWFKLKNTYQDTKEFLSIVKYYRDNNFTYRRIIKMAIKAKREVDKEAE